MKIVGLETFPTRVPYKHTEFSSLIARDGVARGYSVFYLKHRRSYLAELGFRGWLHLFARELARAGDRRGAWTGKLLKTPRRVGL